MIMLQNHQTCSYEQAKELVDQSLEMDFHKDYVDYFGKELKDHFQYPPDLLRYDHREE